jgi:hypothetical protein
MFQKILKEINAGESKTDLESDAEADFAFILGDLNFRFKIKFFDFM